MLVVYEDRALSKGTLETIAIANAILREFQADGLRVTLRQLFYAHVARALLPNSFRAYKNLGEALKKGRLGGLVDWGVIEDRTRSAVQWRDSENIREAVSSAVRGFRLNRLKGQDAYVEVWVEKDALSGVLEPIAARYHVPLMVNRGYGSVSSLRESALRIRRAVEDGGHTEATVLYLGDMDPSGQDMVGNVRERLRMFSNDGLVRQRGEEEGRLEYATSFHIGVEKVGITPAQARAYGAPSNPVKTTDKRAAAYVAAHGRECWEVDALPPKALNLLVSRAIESHLDMEAYWARVEEEDRQRSKMEAAIRGLSL